MLVRHAIFAIVFVFGGSVLANGEPPVERAKSRAKLQLKGPRTQALEFEPDHLNVKLRTRKEVEGERRGRPLRFRVKHKAAATPYIGDTRLMKCIDSQRVGRENVRVFPTEEIAKKNCKVSPDGRILETQYGNTCIHYEYGGANSFTNCYYGDPPNRHAGPRTWRSPGYR